MSVEACDHQFNLQDASWASRPSLPRPTGSLKVGRIGLLKASYACVVHMYASRDRTAAIRVPLTPVHHNPIDDYLLRPPLGPSRLRPETTGPSVPSVLSP